jgi:signal transduction histidine kinase
MTRLFVFGPLVFTTCYLVLAAVVRFRRRATGKAARVLLLYLIAAAVWNVSFVLSMMSWDSPSLVQLGAHAAGGGLVLLAVVYLDLTRTFLGRKGRYIAVWWILGIVSLLSSTLLDPRRVPLTIGRFTVGLGQVIQVVSVFVWAGLTLAAILGTWDVLRKTVSPMHRNRYRYWLLSVALLILGDLLLSTTIPLTMVLGSGINLISAVVSAMAIVRYQLVDIKSLYRRAFGYVAVTLLIVATHLLVILASFLVAGDLSFLATLIGIGITSILLSFAVSPARRAIQRFVDRRIFHLTTDYDRALRFYRDRVVERLRLNSLADLVMETLLKTMHASRGGLYLTEEAQHEVGGLRFCLLECEGDLPVDDFELSPDSVLAVRLRTSGVPLTQYEVDVHEDFASLGEAARDWLRALSIEVLIPIHTSGKMVGLIALGAKGSGEAYSPTDISWLETLAAQTAVALDNARLFDHVESMSVRVMHLNAALEQTYHRLQEVDRLKSEFIGVITHELRSPFVAASMSVELIRRYVNEGMTTELRAQIEALDEELSQGRKMIDGIIWFASFLSKRGELHLEQADVAQLVQGTIRPLEKMARTRNINFSCACPSHLDPTEVDRTRLAEAMYHLVHNAIKFNVEGGSVRVSCWPTETHVVFKVEDTGQGIPPEKMTNIWDVFTQAADNVQRGVEGLGLGLSLVKYVVEAHQGEVWAVSKVGEGSTFGFRIPNDAGGLPHLVLTT